MFKSSLPFLLLSICNVNCNTTSVCTQTEICNSYMDVAISMILKAKDSIPTCPSNCLLKPSDCADVLLTGHNKSGVYEVWPASRLTEGKSLTVYCDMDTSGGGWTVIQRRGDFQRPKDYFYKDWTSYKKGFGDIDKDFWLGNDNIFVLTNQKLYSVRFDLKDVEQSKRYAHYDKFWIDDESKKYMLHISDYSGDANDSMLPSHNNKRFSTKDQDNDNDKEGNCALKYKGAWWYGACLNSNLNGLYHKGKHESYADGVIWYEWKGYQESLEWTEIKIRPKSFTTFRISEITPM